MKNSDIRVLITGASGFIGTNAIDFALGENLTLLNLDNRPPRKSAHAEYWKNVDVRDKDALTQAVREFSPTHIWHLAAKTGMDIRHIDELSANTDGVRNLIEASFQAPNLKRTLFTSSLLVCRNGYVPQNDTDYCPPNLYGESKMIGEKLVRTVPMNGAWVIVRPTSIWGPWFEHSYHTFFQVIDRGLYFHPGSAPIVKPLSFVQNTVYMMSRLLFSESPAVDGQTYYLADYPERPIREWAEMIQRTLGGRKIRSMPVPLLRAVATAGDACKKLGWEDPPLTSFRLNNMLTGASYPTAKIQGVAGALPHSMETGVQRTIDWMREHGHIRRNDEAA